MENNTQLLVNQVLHLYIQRSMHLLRGLENTSWAMRHVVGIKPK